MFGKFLDNIFVFSNSCMFSFPFVVVKLLTRDFCYTCMGFLIVISGCVIMAASYSIISKDRSYTQGRHKLRGL